MMRSCPICRAELGIAALLRPRLTNDLTCPRCAATLRMGGNFAWGFAAGVAAFAVYLAVEGKFAEMSLAIVVGIAFAALQFRYARLEAVRSPTSGPR